MKQQFDFRLERVRKVRVHDEDRAKEALAASLAHRLRGEAQLRAATDQLHAAHADATAAGALPVDATLLQHRQAYLERLERSRIVAELELSRRDAEVDARKRVVQGASQRREVLDRLRDRQAASHAQEFARFEAAQLDEIALQAHLRGTRADGPGAAS